MTSEEEEGRRRRRRKNSKPSQKGKKRGRKTRYKKPLQNLLSHSPAPRGALHSVISNPEIAKLYLGELSSLSPAIKRPPPPSLLSSPHLLLNGKKCIYFMK